MAPARSQEIKLIVGLGNPGPRYEQTRHNIGAIAVQSYAQEAGVKISKKGFSSLWGKGNSEGQELFFLLPQTFMNVSGQAVREALDYYRLSPKDLVVVHDDLDLALERVKWDFNAGAAGHRGISSVIDHLGTKEFYRVRMGIGRPAIKEEVESFVLSNFSKEELKSVSQMIADADIKIRQWLQGA